MPLGSHPLARWLCDGGGVGHVHENRAQRHPVTGIARQGTRDTARDTPNGVGGQA